MRFVFHALFALLLGFAYQVPALAASSMTFFMETGQEDRFANLVVRGGVEQIYASGPITVGTTERFLAFVKKYDIRAAQVYFNSPGGSLIEGMKLGRAIRSLNFHTSVGVYQADYDPNENPSLNSICASACAYAYAGGTSRFLSEYSGSLGIHQFYSGDGQSVSAEEVQQVSGLIVAYLDQMGIDTKAFSISTMADRNGMIWLSPDEALRLRFANNGRAAPVAEIRISNMQPYLRIQQEYSNVTIRVLFGCAENRLMMSFGIVTDSTNSAFMEENQKRSYLELDYNEFLVVDGNGGAQANDSTLWIHRDLDPNALSHIAMATNVSGWIDGFGAVRYGGTLEMPTVRDEITEFANQCYRS